MTNHDWGPLHITTCFVRDAWWIRVNRLLIHALRSKPLFSERHGYIKFTRVPFCKWRFRIRLEGEVTPSEPTSGPRHGRILHLAFDRDESFDPTDFLDEELH